MDEVSLYDICLKRTANLICQGYWLTTESRFMQRDVTYVTCFSNKSISNAIPQISSSVITDFKPHDPILSDFKTDLLDSDMIPCTQTSTSADFGTHVSESPSFSDSVVSNITPCLSPSPNISKSSNPSFKCSKQYLFNTSSTSLGIDELYPVVHSAVVKFKNPFSELPSSIITDLLSLICESSKKLRDFSLLLKSGKVERFCIKPCDFNAYDKKEIIELLKILANHCQNLKSIVIQLCGESMPQSCIDIKVLEPWRRIDVAKRLSVAFECILRSSPLLEVVETSFPFDLRILQKCPRLRNLKINFELTDPLSNLLQNINGKFLLNNSLQTLSVRSLTRSKIEQSGILELLKYCTALTQIYELDLSLPLKHLAFENHGILAKSCNLQTCFLGCGEWNQIHLEDRSIFKLDTLMNSCLPEATDENSINFLAISCPEIEELYIIANVCDFSGLNHLHCLHSLNITWFPQSGNFQSLNPFFENVIGNLKLLSLSSISNLDIEAIGKACPNLEEFYVWYEDDLEVKCFPSTYYTNLKNLLLWNTKGSIGIKQNNLVSLLSNCINLKTIIIVKAACLTDNVLEQILCKNSFCKLEVFKVYFSNLTECGVKNLVEHLPSLKELCVCSSVGILFCSGGARPKFDVGNVHNFARPSGGTRRWIL